MGGTAPGGTASVGTCFGPGDRFAQGRRRVGRSVQAARPGPPDETGDCRAKRVNSPGSGAKRGKPALSIGTLSVKMPRCQVVGPVFRRRWGKICADDNGGCKSWLAY